MSEELEAQRVTYRMLLSNIVWDTDDEVVEGLPDEMIVEVDDDEDDVEAAAVDAATDEIGWCISDCEIERM